jgi:hypothetical protein
MDFSHGWNSSFSNHFYRVEATTNISEESEYVFTIDGIRFDSLPDKHAVAKRNSDTSKVSPSNANYNQGRRESNNEGTSARPSVNTNRSSLTSGNNNSSSSAGNRNNFQSPANRNSSSNQNRSEDSFDPFASNSKSEPFDPFANNNSSSSAGFDPFASNNNDNNNNNSNSNTKATRATPESRSKPLPSASNSHSKSTPTAAKSLFDNMEDENPPPTKKTNTTPAAPAFDAFGDNDTHTNTASNNSNSNFDPFGTAPAGGASNSRGGGSGAQPGRRASAVEISMDFAGLSFEAQPDLQQQKQQQLQQQPRDSPKEEEQPQAQVPKEETAVDPWASNLVDLDLSGRTQATRRASLAATSGPSLNSMLGVNPARRLSKEKDPFGAGVDVVPLNNNPVPMMPMRPVNPSQAISGLGGGPVPPPMGMGGMGMGMGGPGPMMGGGMGGMPGGGMQGGGMGYGAPMPPQQPVYPNNGVMVMGGGRSSMNAGQPQHRGSMMGGQPMGGGMPMPPVQNTRGSFIGSSGYGGPQQQPKSSLDNLEIWK